MLNSLEEIRKNIRILRILDFYFFIIGVIEVLVLKFIFSFLQFETTFGYLFFIIVYGLLTILPAGISLNEKRIRWNYFVGSWAIIRHNPMNFILISVFVIGSGTRRPGESLIVYSNTLLIWIFVYLLILLTFILGIVLISKTNKYNTLKENQKLMESGK